MAGSLQVSHRCVQGALKAFLAALDHCYCRLLIVAEKRRKNGRRRRRFVGFLTLAGADTNMGSCRYMSLIHCSFISSWTSYQQSWKRELQAKLKQVFVPFFFFSKQFVWCFYLFFWSFCKNLQWLRKKRKKALSEALEKIKSGFYNFVCLFLLISVFWALALLCGKREAYSHENQELNAQSLHPLMHSFSQIMMWPKRNCVKGILHCWNWSTANPYFK